MEVGDALRRIGEVRRLEILTRVDGERDVLAVMKRSW